MKKSLVYTKTGDKGSTGLIGGTRVSKNDYRLEAYGTVDELNSNIGMIRSYPIDQESIDSIIRIQRQLFTIGSYLATDESVSDLRTKLKTEEAEIEFMELEMDKMESKLPPLSNFVLPGGHPAVAQCHICRTICRRAERRIITMQSQTTVDEWVIRYVNRLSDYFFVLSRHLTNYFQINEIPWVSGLYD
ncbi:cob(I)yrinic acid a,c-diamide adenosyltransferase [Alkalitalea saponilacus]|uniref:Corrinoid adenosyltransferase n=1 Tax=Alkalitalea saponilacus TaxID=889453 RepID=A0A1T5HLQ0_9BACT|nr:cob(I)yrinic acid a,c-diamide adenosyltransferase [Alkalitalea saponilacus]ASB47835.1 ATP:cob(I)alamin adenosyltransferase [Alkalitalea saponilacus]SKC21582.1 cob(I)alamin adenosyltransferase [Alkalitalea saponilacus]